MADFVAGGSGDGGSNGCCSGTEAGGEVPMGTPTGGTGLGGRRRVLATVDYCARDPVRKLSNVGLNDFT